MKLFKSSAEFAEHKKRSQELSILERIMQKHNNNNNSSNDDDNNNDDDMLLNEKALCYRTCIFL